MKKTIVCLVMVFVFTLAGMSAFASGSPGSSGSSAQAPLTLMQNKPEIGDALTAYGKEWTKSSGIPITIKSIGGTSSGLGQQLKADYAAGDMPDIFVIQGPEDYKQWESILLDMSDQKWVAETSVPFKENGKVYGFPVSIEGWGLAYNADLLKKAGVDPKTLDNYAAYKAAFEKIDSMKSQLGINAVVSMAASSSMSWVVTDHDLNALLSNGLPYGDKSVVNALLAGKVDASRMQQYANWVGLMFKYADQTILTTGDYNAQVNAFATQKAVFLHQGNWVDPNMKQAGVTFEMAFVPYGSLNKSTDGIFVAAPSWYVVNKDSKNVAGAEKFLNDMVFTKAGQDFIVNKADMIPAFKNIDLQPSGQLSKSVGAWMKAGKIYAWNQYYFSSDFRQQVLGPIYNQFATGQIDEAKFIQLMTNAFKNRKS
ncbi:MAG: extracellular solute-binding protein [Anaerolineales bacterium]|jgi:raffinose/stachyose/melibiose transport system substrate-binding protein